MANTVNKFIIEGETIEIEDTACRNSLTTEIKNEHNSMLSRTNNLYDLTNLIIIGDSFTVGFNPSDQENPYKSWAQNLLLSVNTENSAIIAERGIGYNFVNSYGHNALGLWNEKKASISWLNKTTCILIMLGFNDMNTGQDITALSNAIQIFYQQIKQDCPNATIISMFNPYYGIPYPKYIRNIEFHSIGRNVLFWNIECSLTGHEEWFNADRVHPNTAGHIVLRNIILIMLKGGQYHNHWYYERLDNPYKCSLRIIGCDHMMNIKVDGSATAVRSRLIANFPSALGKVLHTSIIPAYIDEKKTCSILIDTNGIRLIQNTGNTYDTGTFGAFATIDGYAVFGE